MFLAQWRHNEEKIAKYFVVFKIFNDEFKPSKMS